MKLKNACILVLLLAALPGAVSAGGKLGIIDVDAPYPSAGSWEQIAEALGYGSERINEEVLADAANLSPYGLIILCGRYSSLHEREYETLAEYVKSGGTLFMTEIAAYWMRFEDEDGGLSTRGIRGGGPMEQVTGARVVLPYRGLVEKFRVLEKNPYTEGLPDEFAYETRPPYDITDERSTRRTEAVRLVASGADTLIESQAYYEARDPDTGSSEFDMETPVRSAFLTVNSYGEGKAVWLACRAHTLILTRSERNILRIVNNVFGDALGR